MAGYRQEQLNELLMCELAQIFRDVKDPRVSDSFVSVTGADVAKDLSVAKVYFSVMNGDPAEVKKGLDRLLLRKFKKFQKRDCFSSKSAL